MNIWWSCMSTCNYSRYNCILNSKWLISMISYGLYRHQRTTQDNYIIELNINKIMNAPTSCLAGRRRSSCSRTHLVQIFAPFFTAPSQLSSMKIISLNTKHYHNWFWFNSTISLHVHSEPMVLLLRTADHVARRHFGFKKARENLNFVRVRDLLCEVLDEHFEWEKSMEADSTKRIYTTNWIGFNIQIIKNAIYLYVCIWIYIFPYNNR